MTRRTSLAFAVVVGLAAATPTACAGAPAARDARAEARPLPLRRYAWSRATGTDARGFYATPIGLCEDYPEESTTVDRVRADVDLARRLGARLLRFGLGWDGVEGDPGRYDLRYWDALVDACVAAGIAPAPYVAFTPTWAARDASAPWRSPPRDPEAYARFVARLADRWRGRVRSWELWNEPDLPDYWTGTPDELASLVRSAALALRRADPDAVVVLGGMAKARSPFLEALFGPGGVAGFVDVVNVHAYLETWSDDRTEALPARLVAVADLARRAGDGADVWLAEFGYSSHRHAPARASVWGVDVVHAHEHTPAHQAAELVEQHALAIASGAPSVVAWYRIHDLPAGERVIGDENNHHLGLVDVEGRAKPALGAFALVARLFAGPVRLARHDRGAGGSQREVLVFERADGGAVVVAWLRSATRAEVADASGLAVDARREVVVVPLPAHYRSFAAWGADGARREVSARLAGRALEGVELAAGEPFVAELAP